MSLIVQKFGGSSVRDAERINHVAGIIADTYRAGSDVIVVLSAQGDTTDDLIEKAKEISPHPSKREMDMLLATGEQISVSLCAMDRAAKTCGVNFIGGYSALVQKGMTRADAALIRSIPEALAQTEYVCSSVNVGSTRAGINMDAVALMGHVIRETARLTEDQQGLGCAKLVVFCNAVEDNPFMTPSFSLAKGRPVSSLTGSASISPRIRMVLPGFAPLIVARTPFSRPHFFQETPMESSSFLTTALVLDSCLLSSGCAWKYRRILI